MAPKELMSIWLCRPSFGHYGSGCAGVCKADGCANAGNIDDPIKMLTTEPGEDQRNQHQEVGGLCGGVVRGVQFAECGGERVCERHGVQQTAGGQIEGIHTGKNGT